MSNHSSINECLNCLQLNLRLIRAYIKDLSPQDTSLLYEKLKEIMFFYGFRRTDIQKMIDYKGTYEEFSREELLEMEGMTNALLFHLKYKMD